jgi:hypothetical protein
MLLYNKLTQIILITSLFSTLAYGKRVKMYEQISVHMGFYKLNMQCNTKKCDVLSFYKGNLMGKAKMTKSIVDGIRSNLLTNFLKIEKATGKCPGQGILIKYYRNYTENELYRCYKKKDYYSQEFQDSFTKVYKAVPPPK